MMTLTEKIKQKIEEALPGAEVEVNSGDQVHFQARVVASQFQGLSRVQQQQKVYTALGDLISTGEVHALSLQTVSKG
ncbi:MAG: BolA family protein [Gammaproteobacteria bacterium]|jgi:acid stress-induced BolA-like protein IbaG/YrbA|nr:BolA family protein [Gammaproteobacteria bacterium]